MTKNVVVNFDDDDDETDDANDNDADDKKQQKASLAKPKKQASRDDSAGAPVDVTAQTTATVHVVKEAKKGLSLASAPVATVAPSVAAANSAASNNADNSDAANDSDNTPAAAAAASTMPSLSAVTKRAPAVAAAAVPKVNSFVDPHASMDFFSDMAPEVKDNRRLDLDDLASPSAASNSAAAAASKRLTLEDSAAAGGGQWDTNDDLDD